MSSLDQPQAHDTYWRSLDELSDAPRFRAFLEAEFPEELDPAGINRRRWLQLMGASLALAGLTGCRRWPQEEIRSLVVRPESRVPGEPEYFATAMELGGYALGLIVTSRDGRPVKVEGNPAHPASLGATHALAQAALLELYDPDRSRRPREVASQAGEMRQWEELAVLLDKHFQPLREQQGAGLAVLAESSTSPTRAYLRKRFAEAMPQARWYEYEPLSDDNAREGSIQAFGAAYRTHYRLDQAEVIVCVDSDLFCTHPNAVCFARAFADGRDPDSGEMNRLYVVESRYTTTGAAADHRVPLQSSRIAAWVARLEAAVQARLASPGPTMDTQSEGQGHDPVFDAVVDDLTRTRARSVVVVGDGQPAEVHAAAHRLNQALGNVGQTVVYYADPDPERPSHAAALSSLVAEIQAGAVKTLVVLGGNPVYNAPSDVKFAEAYARVPMRIHLSGYFDETSRSSTWHVPKAHFLESWDDVRAFDGTYSVQQPLISPLYGGKTSSELLAMLLGENSADGQSLVRRTFQQLFGEANLESNWRRALHDGLVAGSQWPTQTLTLQSSGAEAQQPVATGGEDELELVFYADESLHDGRFANNSWLQETPRPMTKITWDNAVLINPATARSLGIARRTLVRLTHGGQSVEMPVYLLPGQARGTVAVALGYGRAAAGTVGGDEAAGIDAVGVNTYRLRSSNSLYVGRDLRLEPTMKAYALATTEEHHAIDAIGQKATVKRATVLAREGTLRQYEEHPDFAQHLVHHPPLQSLWQEWTYDGHRWGMAIDLSKCVGCNACVVACQAENNVPVVGREQVLRGREMHWIRVDRYFRGQPDDPSPAVSHQVVTCQHCENAPCEQVCPVSATVHSHEGLNDMVYNRCIGTRYCANNCPYKVRRFNFFYFHGELDKPENEVKKMVFNPEVTVRSRGVMEKCSFCVQRIQAVKIDARNGRRPIEDGEIQVACQQACPTRAIEFGDLNNANGQVARAHAAARAYAMLEELNIKPRNAYLARIRNPHPSLQTADYDHDRHTG